MVTTNAMVMTFLMRTHCICVVLALFASVYTAKSIPEVSSTMNVYVHANGHDKHLGHAVSSLTSEVYSLEEARDAVRKWRKSVKNVVIASVKPVITLGRGRHVLTRPLVLDKTDSGVVWKAEEPGLSSISGGRTVEGFAPCKFDAKLMCAPITFTNASLIQPRHLFVSGRRAARSHNVNTAKAFASPISVDAEKYVVDWTTSGAALWDSASIGDVEMVYSANGSPWTESRCTVDRVINSTDGHAEVYMKQPCFAAVQSKPCGQSTHAPALIENTGPHDLQPGQWFLKRSLSASSPAIVVYYPLNGENVEKEEVIMPVLERLVHADALQESSFLGLTWEFATWRRPNTGLGYVEQQSGALVNHPGTECVDYEWKPMPSNIVFSNGPRSILMSNNTFQHLGAGAVEFTGGAHDNTVTTSLFRDVSGTSVQLGQYDTFNQTDPDKQEQRNSVTFCVIDNVANEFHGNAGISVGYSRDTVLEHNDIGSLTYSGISIGWGWSREKDTYAQNNSVSFNKIHDFKLQLSYPGASLGDGGGIYALGPQQNSTMQGNWLSNMGAGRGGGAFYPDEGSAYWTISNNVFSNASMCSDDCQWLHIWVPTCHDIETANTYTDTATKDVAGTNTPVVNTTVVPKNTPYSEWPLQAQKIMKNAGVVVV